MRLGGRLAVGDRLATGWELLPGRSSAPCVVWEPLGGACRTKPAQAFAVPPSEGTCRTRARVFPSKDDPPGCILWQGLPTKERGAQLPDGERHPQAAALTCPPTPRDMLPVCLMGSSRSRLLGCISHQPFVFSPGGEMPAARRCVGSWHRVKIPLARGAWRSRAVPAAASRLCSGRPRGVDGGAACPRYRGLGKPGK